jgi:hypothetical protein
MSRPGDDATSVFTCSGGCGYQITFGLSKHETPAGQNSCWKFAIHSAVVLKPPKV